MINPWRRMAAMAYVVAAVMILIDTAPIAHRLGAIGLAAACAAWQHWFGPDAVSWRHEHRPGRGAVYLSVMFVLFAAAVWLTNASAYLLFAVMVQIYMALPLWLALVPAVVFSLVPWVRSFREADWVQDFLPIVALIALLSQMFAWAITTILDKTREQVQLVEELRRTQALNERLSHEAGVAAERVRLSGEIHDTLAQGFTSIVTLVQAAQGNPAGAPKLLDLALRTARENLVEARALVAALAPTALSGSTLVEAIGRQADRLGEEAGVEVRHRTTGEAGPLPTSVEVVLLRAAQEAFHNVRKHAGASAVEVELAFEEEAVRLSVHDDGRGLGDSAEGFGLRGMRARAEQVGGTLDVSGADGTTLTLRVPR
ncbi:sensor histidine kinase [Umezawaea sp. Da 62-37]|uniref:sensor histidine kinase n=1 Tax=Umezawaea sp. Da 62-37 TaxID=3075927 RepID=UPI0028F6FA52|nr:sensor histidine kinase [Umezawaea sp. Da 62-37]WNV82063.1 sensor histidine kinase [Umezawaea sp. Da 62-37]